MRYICLIILLVFSSSGLCNNIIGGAHPREFYTNSLCWTEDNAINYGIAYSPDGGRTLELTITGRLRYLYGDLLSIASPGLCFLHVYDQNNGKTLWLLQGFGHNISTSALFFGFYEIVQSGFTPNQVFMNDYNPDTYTSTLYKSEQAGYDSQFICAFDSLRIKSIAKNIDTGEIYLLSYDFRDSLMHIQYSDDMGLSFTDYLVPAEVQLPGPVLSGEYMIFPRNGGTLYIGRYDNQYPRSYGLYKFNLGTGETSMIWDRGLDTNEYLYLVPVFSDDIDFIVQKRFNWMSYDQLIFFESCDEGITWEQTGSYMLDGTYINPSYLVPVPQDNPIPATSTDSSVHVRSNVAWSVETEADWIMNISPDQGDCHAELTLSFGVNTTGTDRSAVLNFYSDAARDTSLVIVQSGYVSNSDELTPAPPISGLYCYPNPTKHTTTLRCHLKEECYARIVIYNLKGQVVKRLKEGTLFPGTSEVQWDCRDDRGFMVSSGVYIARLNAPSGSISSKILLLK